MRWPSRSAARRVVAVAALGLTVAAGACGADSDGDAAAAGAASTGAGGDVITIKDFVYSPQPLSVPVGTVVRIVNEDEAAHTATADDGSFDTGDLGEGASKEIKLSAAGELAYHCTIHDYMQGVIRVGD